MNHLYYGDPGAGKTYLCGTAQDVKELSPVLHLGLEMGLLTVAYRKDYDAREIRSIDQLIAVHDLLEEDQKSAKPYYKSLVIDNITELQKLDMGYVMAETKRNAKNPDNVDIDVPSPREWGKSGERMRRIIRSFRDMPIHTFTTAWKGSDYDESTNVVSYYPMLPGKLKGEIPGYYDVVGFLTVDLINNGADTLRKLQVQGTRRVIAKDRTSTLGGVVEDPTIPKLWNLIREAKF